MKKRGVIKWRGEVKYDTKTGRFVSFKEGGFKLGYYWPDHQRIVGAELRILKPRRKS